MATIAKLDVLLGLKGDSFDKGLSSAQSKLNSWGASMRSVGTKLTAGVTVPIVALGIKAIQSASSLEQAQGKVDAVFHESAGVVHDWSTTTTDAFGISQTAALQASGTMGNFFTSAGIALDQSAAYSMQLVQLSADMGAFNDVSAARATEAIISGMAGEYDSLQRLGVNITAAKVEQEAMNIATADGRDTITEADLALARYNVIMRESTNQHGQFAREADGFAGKLAKIQARISDLSAKWGAKLMPIAIDFLDVIESLTEWVDNLSPSMQRWAIIIAAVAAALGPALIAIGLMLPGLAAVLGLIGALLSPIGLLVAAAALLAFAFRDEIASALDTLMGKIQFAINVFQNLRDVGLSPVQAALQTLAVLFPALGSVIAPLRQLVENLGDAFAALKAGDYAAMFDALGAAARNVGSAILAAIRMIDWGGIASALWDGIQTAAAWVGDQVLEIPELIAEIGAWAIEQVKSVAATVQENWPRWVASAKALALDTGELIAKIAGWALQQAKSLAGAIADRWPSWVASAKAVSLDMGELLARVTGWTFSLAKSVASALAERWPEWAAGAKAVALEIADIVISILSFSPTYSGTPVDILIENMIGAVTVKLSNVALQVTSFKVSEAGLQRAIQIAAGIAVAAAALSLAAFPVTVPVALVLGTVAALLLSFALWQWVADWARRNPLEAVDMLVGFAISFDRAASALKFGIQEIIEFVLNELIGATGGSVQIDLPVSFNIGWGGDDKAAEQSAAAVAAANQAQDAGLAAGGGGGGRRQQDLGAGIIRNIEQVRQSIASALDSVKTGTIQPKIAEWGGALATGLAPLAGIAATSFGAVNVAAAGQLGMALASVSSNTGQMNATSTANFGAMQGNAASRLAGMLGNTTANFTSIRSTGISNTQQLGSSVASSIASMANNVGSSMGDMASRAISSANQMRSGTVSAAQSAGIGIASAIATGTSNAVSAAAGNFGRLAGAVTSGGSAAVGAARSLGSNIGSALAGALEGMIGRVSAAASALANAAAGAMALALQVSSPSRIGIWLGEMTGEGLAIGLDRMVGTVGRSADALGEAALPDISRVSDAFSTSGTAGGGQGGEVKQYFFALTSDEFKALLAKAERGAAFAEGFAGEIGMQEGRV